MHRRLPGSGWGSAALYSARVPDNIRRGRAAAGQGVSNGRRRRLRASASFGGSQWSERSRGGETGGARATAENPLLLHGPGSAKAVLTSRGAGARVSSP
ncbi:hypothetical protein NDU88_003492 [Pleurodeles waltl]|uniref:Uncharacterized protein n=1 Tax=Pleurodeles waltl TaxID=8319 RepID=A0AAV7KWN8_PLEWA|nr:hypothetical protein NDU88_003492 [Pleurodeles waltl]